MVKITAAGKPVTLTFGQPKPTEGESRFTLPAYVRVNDTQEVVKLGPDVMPVVSRAATRTAAARSSRTSSASSSLAARAPADPFSPPVGSSAPTTVTLPGEETERIRVSRTVPGIFNFDLTPLFSYTLTRTGTLPEPAIFAKGGEPVVQPERLADVWELAAPTRDRVDPTRLRSRSGRRRRPVGRRVCLTTAGRGQARTRRLAALDHGYPKGRRTGDGSNRRHCPHLRTRGDDHSPRRPARFAAAETTAQDQNRAPLRPSRRQPASLHRKCGPTQ